VRRIAFLLVATAASFILAYSVSASSSHYLAADWPSNPDYYVDSSMASPFNSSTAQTEMANARLAWNNVSGAWMDINYVGTTSMSSSITVSSVPSGRIYITDSNLSGSVFGVTTTVYSGSNITKALSEMDTGLLSGTWYISSGTSMGNRQLDLRSGALHELGHAIGFNNGHIDDVTDCSNWNVAQTMCSDHVSTPSGGGPFYPQYRTLASHEQTDHATNY